MSRSLLLIVAFYLTCAVIFGLVTPIYEGPDEVGHVLYVKHIAEGLGIPIQSPAYAIDYGFVQEGSQTPLYYALNAWLIRGLGLSLEDLDGVPPSNPFSTCGRPTSYNVARYRHDPRAERFPYRGAARAVHVMRLFSALLGAVTVVAVYATARLAFPRSRQIALLAAILVGCNPQMAFMGGVVNNDNLVNALTAVGIALGAYCWRYGFTWRRTLALGLVCGVAPLAKLGGLMTLGFAGLVLLVRCWHSPRRFLGYGALLGILFGALSGWWFVRNWILYGELTGVDMMRSIVGGREGWPAHLIIPELVKTFRSYWASFACELGIPAPAYWFFGLIVALGVVGWIARRRTVSPQEREIALLLLIWLGLITVLWVRWNQITYAPLGRLFFQANAAIAPLLAYGLVRLTRQPNWVVVGLGVILGALTWMGALYVVRPAFTLPERHSLADFTAPTEDLPPTFIGESIEVLGFEVTPASVEAGQTVDVTLFLRATEPMTAYYGMALQVLSPVSGDDTVLVNFNTAPGGGNYPTYAWRTDEVIEDRYRLQIPPQVTRTRAWRVGVIFYRIADGERLPVVVAGQPAGGMLGLDLIRVGASDPLPDVPAGARLDPAPVFGDAIRLEGLALEPAGDQWRVDLWWRAVAPLDVDYTTLIHLYDAQGALVAVADTPPMEGRFPTPLWVSGDLITGTHRLPREGHVLGIGWYDPVSGARLEGSVDDTPLPDGIYTLPVGRDE
jgi:hypothetical protein